MCPNCEYTWSEDIKQVMYNLKKVQFQFVKIEKALVNIYSYFFTELVLLNYQTSIRNNHTTNHLFLALKKK